MRFILEESMVSIEQWKNRKEEPYDSEQNNYKL